MTTTVVSWNIAKKHAAWRELVEMGADVALLQEAGKPLATPTPARTASLPRVTST